MTTLHNRHMPVIRAAQHVACSRTLSVADLLKISRSTSESCEFLVLSRATACMSRATHVMSGQSTRPIALTATQLWFMRNKFLAYFPSHVSLPSVLHLVEELMLAYAMDFDTKFLLETPQILVHVDGVTM